MLPLQATLLHRLSPEEDYLDISLLRISGFVLCQFFCSYVALKPLSLFFPLTAKVNNNLDCLISNPV